MDNKEYKKEMQDIIINLLKQDNYTEDYMKNTDSKYITFLENNAICSPSKISKSVWRLELYKDIQIINASWQYINSDTVIAHPDIVYKNIMNDKFYSGYKIIKQSIICNDNIYG